MAAARSSLEPAESESPAIYHLRTLFEAVEKENTAHKEVLVKKPKIQLGFEASMHEQNRHNQLLFLLSGITVAAIAVLIWHGTGW